MTPNDAPQVELLPLPGGSEFLFSDDEMRAYASANVEANVADLRADVERLDAEARQHFQQALSNGSAALTAEARAERLAEALRECRNDYEHALGMSEATYRQWCRSGASGPQPNDTWPVHCERRKQQIDSLLATHAAQPGDDDGRG